MLLHCRRRAPQGKEDVDVPTKEPINYDDTIMDPIDDPEGGESSARARRRSVRAKKRILII
jgi:hypothetical protein